MRKEAPTYFLMSKNEIRADKLKVEFRGFQKTCGHSVLTVELRNELWKMDVLYGLHGQ